MASRHGQQGKGSTMIRPAQTWSDKSLWKSPLNTNAKKGSELAIGTAEQGSLYSVIGGYCDEGFHR